jgi:hypothetical protein
MPAKNNTSARGVHQPCIGADPIAANRAAKRGAIAEPDTSPVPKKGKKKTAPTRFDFIATDSEWDATTKPDDPWLSTAFASRRGAIVFVRPDLPDKVVSQLESEAAVLGVKLVFRPRDDGTSLLDIAGEHLIEPGAVARTDLVFFYSPKDVEYALGFTAFDEAIRAGKVRQRSNVAGSVGVCRLRDVAGWPGKQSLLAFARAMGIETPSKTKMDDYKTEMYRGLTERPRDFLRYAVADARVLLDLFERFTGFTRSMMSDVLEMPDEELWTARDIPMTIGRLVASTFERWLWCQVGLPDHLFAFCDLKLGLLDPDHAEYRDALEVRHVLIRRCRSPKCLDECLKDPYWRALWTAFDRGKYLFTAVSASSVNWWASRATTETAGYNAMVHGGRCHNEWPHQYRTGPGLDIDISGCYGASLRSLTFPIGVPTVWSYSPNAPPPTLGRWLRENESQLVPGLWTCVVRGKLRFEQDLLYSKVVRSRDLRRQAAGQDDADPESDFVLMRREVQNAVVTHDLLEALRKTASNAEWAELKRLEVVTAVAYLKRDRRADGRRWCRDVMADEGDPPGRARPDEVRDRRTRAWFGVPLEGFVGRLVDARRSRGRGRPGLDSILKLFINTTYGVLASRYFSIGNTVLANNITARGRLGVWMLAKALGLRQTITDGGIYTPDQVPQFRPDRRPGLDVLSRPALWSDSRRGRSLAPMAGFRWPGEPGTAMPLNADDLATRHVRRYWKPYGLTFPFDLAHKAEHTFVAAAYLSKADNAMRTAAAATPIYKLRGKNRASKHGDRKRHPTFDLLDAILRGSDEFPADLSYEVGGILRIPKYLQAQESAGGYVGLKGLRPGDSLPLAEYLARFNNTHMPTADAATWRKRRNRKKVHRRKPVAWFERYGPQGIARVHRKMMTDDLRT